MTMSALFIAKRLYSTASPRLSLLRKLAAPFQSTKKRLEIQSDSKEHKKDQALGNSENAALLPAVTGKASNSSKRLEKFIPVTRRNLLRILMEDERLLSSDEKRLMENLAAALDAKYFKNILEQSKVLYDGMDPDKDTYQSRVLSRKAVLDNEYYLLQKVEKLLKKANFFEIPKKELLTLLHDQDADGIIVSVDPSEYELLRVWTRGQEQKKRSPFAHVKDWLLSSLLQSGSGPASIPMLYTRVFLAVRSRGEKKLHLKVFKEIHTNELEHLLPKGKIKMSTFDKSILWSSVVLGGCLPFTRILPVLSDYKIQFIWGGLGLAGLMAGRAWISYKNKRNHYLARLATTLYFKTVANNRGVLTLLTDRAQDEEFKEALLAYVFLLCPAQSESSLPIYDTPDSLKIRIESWLEKNFQLKDFSFDIQDAMNKLSDLGLLVQRRNGTVTVVSVEAALSLLPEPSERWLAVGARRDSQSLDEQMGEEKISKKKIFIPGWN